jgi:hypothetical protein
MEYTKVSSFIDLEALGAEKQAFEKLVEDLITKLKTVGVAEIKLQGAASFKDQSKALADLQKAQTAANQSAKTYEKTLVDQAKAQKLAAASAKDAAAAEALQAKATKDATAAKVNEAKAVKETNAAKVQELKADKELAAIETQNAKTSTENAKAKLMEQKYTQALTKEKENLERASAKEQKSQEKLTNAYEQLKAKYLIAANTAKRLGAELGVNSQEFKDAATASQGYYQSLIGIEEAVGQSQRKVGQYTNATFALSQILREAPSFAYSFQTGLLGISNNIPILVDQVQKLNEVTGSAFKSFAILAKSLFSVNNVITIGVGLLTIFSGAIINSITGTKKLDEAQKDLLETHKQINDVLAKRFEDTPGHYLEDDIRSQKEFIALQEKSGATREKLLALEEAAAKTELTIAYQKNRLAVYSAENEKKNVDAGVKGQKALSEAYTDAATEYSVALGTQSTILNRLSETQKKGKDATDDYGASIKEIKHELDEQNLIVETAKQKLDFYKGAVEGVVKAQQDLAKAQAEIARFNDEENRKFTLESARIETDIVIKKNDIILNSDRSSLAQRLAALQSNLTQRKRALQAENEFIQKDSAVDPREKLAAQKKADGESLKATLEYQTERFKVKEEFRLRDLEADKTAYVQEQKLIVDINKELAQSTELSYVQRTEAAEKYFTAQKKIIDAEFKIKLQQAGFSDNEIATLPQKPTEATVKNKKVTLEELISLQKDYENEVLQLGIDTNEQTTANLARELGKQKDLKEKDAQDQVRIYEEAAIARQNQYAGDVIALNKSFQAGKVKYKQYLEDRRKLDEAYTKDLQAATIKQLLTQIDDLSDVELVAADAKKKVEETKREYIRATTDEERKAIKDRLDLAIQELIAAEADVDKKIALRKKLADAEIGESERSANKQKQIAEELAGYRKQIADEALAVIQTLGDASFQRQKDQIEEQIALLEKKRDKDIQVAEQTAVNAQEAADRVTLINAKFNADKDRLDRQQRQVQERQAKFDKALGIAKIVVDTAAAIIATLRRTPPPEGIPLAVAVGVIGALQLAKAIATPIPKYKHGLKEAKEDHIGITGDAYKHELVRFKDGTGWITPNKPTLTWIPKGASIDPEVRPEAIGKQGDGRVYFQDTNTGGIYHITNEGDRIYTEYKTDGKEVYLVTNEGDQYVERHEGDHVVNQVTNQEGDQVVNKSGDKVYNQEGDEVINQVSHTEGDRTVNQGGDKVYNDAGDEITKNLSHTDGDKVVNEAGDKTYNREGDELTRNVSSVSGDKVTNQAGDQVYNQQEGQHVTNISSAAGDKVVNQAGDKILNDSSSQEGDRISTKTGDTTKNQVSNVAGDKILSQAGDNITQEGSHVEGDSHTSHNRAGDRVITQAGDQVLNEAGDVQGDTVSNTSKVSNNTKAGDKVVKQAGDRIQETTYQAGDQVVNTAGDRILNESTASSRETVTHTSRAGDNVLNRAGDSKTTNRTGDSITHNSQAGNNVVTRSGDRIVTYAGGDIFKDTSTVQGDTVTQEGAGGDSTVTKVTKGGSVYNITKKAGDMVYNVSNKEKQAILYRQLAPAFDKPTVTSDPGFERLIRAVVSDGKATRKAIQEKRETHLSVVNGQIAMTTKDGYNETSYLNQNLNF